MDEILEIKQKNEEITRKFFKIEENIASPRDARDLFEKLLINFKEEFAIPYIWFSFIDKSEVQGLLRELETSELLKDHLNFVEASVFLGLINNSTIPVLANDNLKPFYKLLPQNKKYFIKSLAIAPISCNSNIIGSLNYGDSSQLRYQPEMDSSLLYKLAGKVSLYLSNMLSRKQRDLSSID